MDDTEGLVGLTADEGRSDIRWLLGVLEAMLLSVVLKVVAWAWTSKPGSRSAASWMPWTRPRRSSLPTIRISNDL